MLALLGTNALVSDNFCHVGKFIHISNLKYVFYIIILRSVT